MDFWIFAHEQETPSDGRGRGVGAGSDQVDGGQCQVLGVEIALCARFLH